MYASIYNQVPVFWVVSAVPRASPAWDGKAKMLFLAYNSVSTLSGVHFGFLQTGSEMFFEYFCQASEVVFTEQSWDAQVHWIMVLFYVAFGRVSRLLFLVLEQAITCAKA